MQQQTKLAVVNHVERTMDTSYIKVQKEVATILTATTIRLMLTHLIAIATDLKRTNCIQWKIYIIKNELK